jgi:glycosyltransferase involved in cell wall biosynthesis
MHSQLPGDAAGDTPRRRIVLTVTNDLTYDQRMQRIATTLVEAGYAVELIGRTLPRSVPLERRPYAQTRLSCRFHHGFAFYAEYNLRLFAYLLRARYDAIGTVDLDTLPAGALAGVLRGKRRVFDAHEHFTEVPEVTGRPFVKAFWSAVARLLLPFYRHAYTVGPALAGLFSKKFGTAFAVVRNVPLRTGDFGRRTDAQAADTVLYQGALNAGRGLEAAIDAMQQLDGVELWLAGEGDLSAALRRRVRDRRLEGKVKFLGFIKPAELQVLTGQAWLGLNLLENKGLSYYYSLANKFFDYVQAAVPGLTMNFPEYRALNAEYEVAVLLDELTPDAVATAIRRLRDEPGLYARLQENCRRAAAEWNWERDRAVLLEVWQQAFAG